MPKHLLRDLDRLRKELLSLGSMVEDATRKAILTVTDARSEFALEVIEGDSDVDAQEVLVEDECLKVLALHQPVAQDLRFVMVVLKVNNDLERAGDLARNIAARGRDLAGLSTGPVPTEILKMAEIVQRMLHDSLNSVVLSDTEIARHVLGEDDQVDLLHKKIFEVVKRAIRSSQERLDELIHLLSVSRYLERIADLATNIAEEVVFMVDGEIIRHRNHW